MLQGDGAPVVLRALLAAGSLCARKVDLTIVR